MNNVQEPAKFTVDVNVTAILPECCFGVLYCVKSCDKIDDRTAILNFGNNTHIHLNNFKGEKHYLQHYDKCLSTPYVKFSEKTEEKIPEYLIYQTDNNPSIDIDDFSHKYHTIWDLNDHCENNKINLNIKKIYNDLYISSKFMIPDGYKALNDVYYKIELFDKTYNISEILRDNCEFNNKTIKISNCLLNKNQISIKIISNNDLYIALKNESVIGTIYKFNTLSCVEINKI